MRRLGLFAVWLLFLLLLAEGSLRLAGFALTVPHRLAARGAGPAGELAILAVGESTTFGLYVDPGLAYPNQLEHRLEAHLGRPVRVFNAGVPAQTSTSILRSIDHLLLEQRPDIVLMLFGTNDINESLNDISARRVGPFLVPELVADLRLFKLASVLRDVLLYDVELREDGTWIVFDPEQLGPDGELVIDLSHVEQLELNYGDVIERVRQRGAIPVMLTYLTPDHPLREPFARIAARHDVLLIDTYSPETHDERLFTEDGFHPNAYGHRVMAEALAEGLLAAGLPSAAAGASGSDGASITPRP